MSLLHRCRPAVAVACSLFRGPSSSFPNCVEIAADEGHGRGKPLPEGCNVAPLWLVALVVSELLSRRTLSIPLDYTGSDQVKDASRRSFFAAPRLARAPFHQLSPLGERREPEVRNRRLSVAGGAFSIGSRKFTSSITSPLPFSLLIFIRGR